MMKFKSCQKCIKGDVEITYWHKDVIETCVQCGWHRETPLNSVEMVQVSSAELRWEGGER